MRINGFLFLLDPQAILRLHRSRVSMSFYDTAFSLRLAEGIIALRAWILNGETNKTPHQTLLNIFPSNHNWKIGVKLSIIVWNRTTFHE